jgi:hypothetical protein
VTADTSMSSAPSLVSAAIAVKNGRTLVSLISQAMVAAVVTMVAIGIYDVVVRQPRTPRLAVVDVARLYELAHEKATRNALMAVQAIEAPGGEAASERRATNLAREALSSFYRTPEEFGPALSRTMEELSKQCGCTLVAMSTVFGADSNVPDYTDLVADRLELGAQVTADKVDKASDGGSR